jgi:Fe2+ transport system protein FeoA
VSAVAGDDNLVQRLLEMGLLEGEPVEVTRVAPLGDPIEIRLRDYRLSLRKSEARCVTVDEDGARSLAADTGSGKKPGEKGKAEADR